MFSSIYSKLHEGLTSLRVSTVAGEPVAENGVSDERSGREILAKYQEDWKWIRCFAEVNSTNAKDLDGRISVLHRKMTNSRATFDRFSKTLDGLEEVFRGAEQVLNDLSNLKVDIVKIEDLLSGLEDLTEVERLNSLKTDELEKVVEYREMRLSELDRFRAMLSNEHERKIRTKEEIDSVLKTAKSTEYERKFDEEMKNYKKTKQVPKRVSDKSELNLENVELDQDQEELTKYLS